MAVKHIDVVSMGPIRDVAILEVRSRLRGRYLSVSSVSDMAGQVEGELIPGLGIGRLRLFGHGCPGLFALGQVPASTSISTLSVSDTGKVVCIVSGTLLNEGPIRRLASRFDRSGWVELHACEVASGSVGEELLARLSSIWNVNVLGGDEIQYPDSGIEGTTVIARPAGIICRRRR